MSVLSNIKQETKSAWIPFPGIRGFEVHVGAMSREYLRKIRKEAEITKMDPMARTPVKELDDDIFAEKFAEKAILGWKGLTYRGLSDLMLINEDAIEDLDEEVPFSTEDAIVLMKESQGFDSWLNQQVFNLQNFRGKSKTGNAKGAAKVSG